MHRYADPTRCPNCGSYATGTQRCAHCGLLLMGPEPQELIRILDHADRVLDNLRAEASAWRRDQRPAAPGASSAPGSPWTPYPAPMQADGRRENGRRWTVGSTLLALGALCLVVAAFVFVSVSWDALGLLGRTMALVAVTAAVGVAGSVVVKRRLRASSEALWSVFLALLTFDYLGARAYGLLGMDAWSPDHAALVLGVLVVAVAAGLGATSIRVAELRLWTAETGAGVGLTIALIGFVGTIPYEGFWAAITAAVVTFGAAVGLHYSGLRSAVWYAAGLVALAQLTAISAAVGETFAHSDIRALLTHDGALQTIVASAMTYLLGLAAYGLLRRRGRGAASQVATATTAVAITPTLAIAYAPAVGSAVTLQVVASVALVLSAVGGVVVSGPWLRGIRVTAMIAAVPPLAMAAAWLSTAATTVVGALTPVWSADALVVMDPVDNALGPVVLAPVVLCSLAVAVAVTGWYADLPVLVQVRTPARWAAVWTVLAGGFAAVCLLSPPVMVVALIPVGVGLVTVAVARRPVCQLAGIGLAVAASVVPVASPVASVAVWGVVILSAGAIAAIVRQQAIRTVATGVATAYLHLTLIGVADLAGAEGEWLQLSLVACVVATAVAAQFVRVASVRGCAEVVSAGFGFVALVGGLPLALAWQSAMFTTLGVACGVLALIRADRRFLGVVGGALTGIGYILRLVASGVDVIEAYTLPFGVILLAVGYATMRRSSLDRTSVVLVPGLTMSLLPSLPAVLIDPTTLRGLLLGLAALAVLGVGIGSKWRAPFVTGTALVALITMRHIGPYAEAVPRWSLIALAGAVMLVVGVTWESRVRDARALASFVGAMR